MSAYDDSGPAAPARWRVYRDARELVAWAQRAVELSTEGPRADVPRALGLLDRMRTILGEQTSRDG